MSDQIVVSGAPDPMSAYPFPDRNRTVFLKPLITVPYIEVGEYTYYDDPDDAAGFERNNVLYPFGPEKLIIGKYCPIAAQTRFLLSAANHPLAGRRRTRSSSSAAAGASTPWSMPGRRRGGATRSSVTTSGSASASP